MCVFLIKLLNTSSGVNKLLLAGEKWMTGGTNLNLNGLVYRTKLYFIATGAFG